jgi:hypothetical protein
MKPQITVTRVYKPPLVTIDTHRAAEAAADLECRLDDDVAREGRQLAGLIAALFELMRSQRRRSSAA